MESAPLDWERHKEVMGALYVDENNTLKDVMEIMSRPPYNFFATKKQYERQFKKRWRFRKNLTKQDWRIIHFKVSKRQSMGKRTEVLVDGRLQRMEKIEHEVSRYGLNKSAVSDSEPKTPDGICVHTPKPASPTPSSATVNQFGPVVQSPGSTEHFSTPGSITGLKELDLVWTMSQMDGLPYFELSKLFNMVVHASPNQVASLKLSDLASFIVLSDAPKRNGKDSIKELGASQRTSLLKAMIPPSASTLATLTDFDHTEDQLVQFLTHAAYLLYNGLGSSELGVFVAQFLGAPQNRQVAERFMSTPSTVIEAFTEELFLSFLDQGNDQAALGLLQQGRVTVHAIHLVEASRTGCLQTVELLLQRGIDPDSRPASRKPLYLNANSTALEYAVFFKHPSVAKKLVDHGADPKDTMPGRHPSNCAFVDVALTRNAELLDYFFRCPTCQDFKDSDRSDYHVHQLMKATFSGDIDMLKALLPYIDVNQCASDGYSAVTLAALNGDENIVSFLLHSGASANRTGRAAELDLGPSPLQAAIEGIYSQKIDRQNLEIIHLLISHGADPNEAPEKTYSWGYEWSDHSIPKRTAIQAAAGLGHEELFFYLLDRGADPYAPAAEYHGLTALQAALRSGHDTLWTFFSLTPGNLSTPRIHAGTTALIEAARSGNVAAVRQFLDSGCDVNDTGSTYAGCTALSAAIMTGDMVLVQLLLDFGATVRHRPTSQYEWTVLQAALWTQNADLVRTLIAMGVNVFNEIALLIAVSKCPIDIINMILSKIDAKTTSGSTRKIKGQAALCAAIEERDASIVLRLLQSGINPNRAADDFEFEEDECHECERERDLTCGQSGWLIEENLYHRFYSGERPLEMALRHRKKDIVALLLQYDADANLRTRNGTQTMLTTAILSDMSDMVEVMLANGANINAPAAGHFGRTALQAATEHGKVNIVELLLDGGADCKARPAVSGGATALQFASMKGYLQIARIFLARGADPNERAAPVNGRTALEGAAEYGRLDMLQLLLNYGALMGEPGSISSKRIISLAYKHGHIAVIKFLKTHQAKTYGPGFGNGELAGEYSFITGAWRVCHECSWGYEVVFGHRCSDYYSLEE